MGEHAIPDSVDDLAVDCKRLLDSLGGEIEALVRERDDDALERLVGLCDRLANEAQMVALGGRLARTQLPVEDDQ